MTKKSDTLPLKYIGTGIILLMIIGLVTYQYTGGLRSASILSPDTPSGSIVKFDGHEVGYPDYCNAKVIRYDTGTSSFWMESIGECNLPPGTNFWASPNGLVATPAPTPIPTPRPPPTVYASGTIVRFQNRCNAEIVRFDSAQGQNGLYWMKSIGECGTASGTNFWAEITEVTMPLATPSPQGIAVFSVNDLVLYTDRPGILFVVDSVTTLPSGYVYKLTPQNGATWQISNAPENQLSEYIPLYTVTPIPTPTPSPVVVSTPVLLPTALTTTPSMISAIPDVKCPSGYVPDYANYYTDGTIDCKAQSPGFEAIIAIIGLLIVAYVVLKNEKKKKEE